MVCGERMAAPQCAGRTLVTSVSWPQCTDRSLLTSASWPQCTDQSLLTSVSWPQCLDRSEVEPSKMSLSDSDSDCEFVKTSSVKGHKSAPNDEKFRIKIKARNKKTIGLLYTLVKGQVLPYTPELEGHQIAFGQDLKPDMGPGWVDF